MEPKTRRMRFASVVFGPLSSGVENKRTTAGYMSVNNTFEYFDHSPYLAVSPLCICPLLPEMQRPRPRCKRLGTPIYPRTAASTGHPFTRLQSFAHVQAPTLARPPGCSHRRRSRSPGRPGRLHRTLPGWLPAPGSGIATCPTRATGMAGLAPAGVQPCRLLLHPLDDTQHFMENSRPPIPIDPQGLVALEFLSTTLKLPFPKSLRTRALSLNCC